MTPFPEDFNTVVIDLEVDLADQGGIQRFKTIADFSSWITEERGFWNWLQQEPARSEYNRITPIRETFFQCIDSCNGWVARIQQNWQNRRQEYDRLTANADEKSREDQIKMLWSNFQSEIQQFKNNVTSSLVQDIVHNGRHVFRGTLNAEFVKNMAEENPQAAVYALHQILLEDFNANPNEAASNKGRILAVLFKRGLLPKKQGQKLAYAETVKTWSKELGHFKNDYEMLLGNFEVSRNAIAEALKGWQEKALALQDEFKQQKEANSHDLENLKQTYEVHMQLQGPMMYWRGKRKQHAQRITTFRNWSIASSIVGFFALIYAANKLLPSNHPAQTIPWREIGFFLLISTFVLWGIRLLVKLLLSHIHLYADAQEREVMISTYMALIRRQESRDSLTKEDMAIVLAPIFRPSTTGVIKDEGGPVTFTDFLTKLAAGKNG